MARIKIILPPYEHQLVFSKIAEKIEKQLCHVIKETELSNYLIDSLMAKAFTGELVT